MAKIYTKAGDSGETNLGNSRVSKADLRIEALGSLDELNSLIGLVRSKITVGEVDNWLEKIQKNIFSLGAEVATGNAAISEAHVFWLEEKIDIMNAKLPPLGQFILPGGSETGALLHVARTSSRNAERRLVQAGISGLPLHYLNRLSDFLFVLGRWQNRKDAEPETKWYVGDI